MRTNLTKKDLVNIIYMQVGFSKQISEHLIDEFFSLIILNLKKERIGRNPKTMEDKIISERNVVLFKPSKEFKEFINSKNE